MATPENKSSWMILIIAAIAILAVVAVSVTKQAPPVTVYGDNANERNILTVTGTHELEVAPDEAVVLLGVVTRNAQASIASSENRDLMNDVVSALRAEGIAASDIETTNVYLQKVSEWDYKEQRSIDRGYEQRATVRVTVKDLESVGTILDAAVSAGANSVESIEFTLTPASEKAYKEQALAAAATVAKSKAATLAQASGATLGRITSLSENSYNYAPYYANTRAVMAMDSAGAEKATPISPEKVSISVSVTIGYELQ